MGQREELQPYKHRRLGFEGVYVEHIKPSKRNGETYGLVFASVYAKNENIELDHVVIKIDRHEFIKAKMEKYKRYSFSAKIGTYYKTAYILGIPAKRENFMLTDLNLKKLSVRDESDLKQPTRYVNTRITSILTNNATRKNHTRSELNDVILTIPNDGKVEGFMAEFTRAYQNKALNLHDIIDALYTK